MSDLNEPATQYDIISISDRLALAVCRACQPLGGRECRSICPLCRRDSTAVAHELAQILRERHGGSSTTADWLDGVGCHQRGEG